MSIQERAQLAFDSGEVTKIPCSNKDDALHLIENGSHDLLHVIGTGVFETGPVFQHYAIRFNDRELGDQIRDLCLRGFGLR